MKRKPDYVFNVCGDGSVTVPVTMNNSVAHERRLNGRSNINFRVTHRIKVYLKEQK